VDQVAAYPLFRFPYTALGRNRPTRYHVLGLSLRRRRMLRILEDIFYRAGHERTSVWAFTRRGVPRYCSVTVPLYLGLGASGGSYLKDVFYLNTFDVAEYVRALDGGGLGIALSIDLSEKMQRAGWLYWRIYETRFRKGDYRDRFGEDLDATYGRYLRPLRRLGLLTDDGEQVVLFLRRTRNTVFLAAQLDIDGVGSTHSAGNLSMMVSSRVRAVVILSASARFSLSSPTTRSRSA